MKTILLSILLFWNLIPNLQAANCSYLPFFQANSVLPALRLVADPTYDSAGSLHNYLRYEGVALLASMAHPSNDFVSGSFKDYSDYIYITFKTKDWLFGGIITTELYLYKSGSFFSGIKVLGDNDVMPPFSALDLLKLALDDVFGQSSSYEQRETQGFLERQLRKGFSEFSGKDLALFAINLDWQQY